MSEIQEDENMRETKTPYGDSVYWHINNGGVDFQLKHRRYESKLYTEHVTEGPVLCISASHFGCTTNGMELLTNKKSLLALGQLLIQYAQDPAVPETSGCSSYGASILQPPSSDECDAEDGLPIDKSAEYPKGYQEAVSSVNPNPEPDRRVPGGMCSDPRGPCQARHCQGEASLLVRDCGFFNSAGNAKG